MSLASLLFGESSHHRVLCGLALTLWFIGCQPPPSAPRVPQQPSVDAAPANEESSAQAEADATAVDEATPQDGAGLPAGTRLKDGGWWEIPYPETFDQDQLSQRLPIIQVKGNKFVDEAGAVVVFQGVNISDPDKIERNGHWAKAHFEKIASWGANVVRIPVHPSAWRGRGKKAYFELLDEAVVWATDLGLYLVIDWHSIGNLRTGLFQHPMYNTSRQETYEFWRAMAHRYKGVPTVAFYELFNEPTVYNGTLGTMTWSEWKTMAEEMISIIQAHDPEVIALVGGFNWAYDLRSASRQPINRKNIAYVSHPYPQKTTAPFERNWDRDFGNMARRYPLFATEIGYMPADAPGAHVPVKDDGSYGKRITDYLDKKGASWVAWCFDPEWAPQLIADWDYTPTVSGEHFRTVMLATKAERDAVKQAAADKAAAEKAAADKKAAEKAAKAQAVADKKAAAEKAAADKKAAAEKAAADKKAAVQPKAEQKPARTAAPTATAAPQANKPAPSAPKPAPVPQQAPTPAP